MKLGFKSSFYLHQTIITSVASVTLGQTHIPAGGVSPITSTFQISERQVQYFFKSQARVLASVCPL